MNIDEKTQMWMEIQKYSFTTRSDSVRGKLKARAGIQLARCVIDRTICGIIIALSVKTPCARSTDKIYVLRRAFNYVLWDNRWLLSLIFRHKLMEDLLYVYMTIFFPILHIFTFHQRGLVARKFKSRSISRWNISLLTVWSVLLWINVIAIFRIL